MADILSAAPRTGIALNARAQERTFETLTWPYTAGMPIMNAIAFYVQLKKGVFRLFGAEPKTNSMFVDGLSINSRRMKDGATRWPSLNTCYNFRIGEGPTALHRVIDAAWMHIRNAQAVRNRLKIAKREMSVAVQALRRPGRPVRILSLAAGTAQGVIEVAAECKSFGIECEIMLIDQDRSALRYAKDLAHRHGVSITTIDGNVLMFNKLVGDFKADIVEMMGLLDYLRDSLAQPLIRKIRLHMESGGYFFCCHIHPNNEQYFLKHVVDWDSGMLYRTRDEFAEQLHKGGFLTPRLITEPHKIHTVSVAQKI